MEELFYNLKEAYDKLLYGNHATRGLFESLQWPYDESTFSEELREIDRCLEELKMALKQKTPA